MEPEEGLMSKIHLTAKFSIPPAHLEEFEALAQTLIARVEATEPTTEQYLWFYNEDKSECMVREIYADSAAAMVHIGNCGGEVGRLVELAPLQLEICGPVSEELAAVAASFHADLYASDAIGVSR